MYAIIYVRHSPVDDQKLRDALDSHFVDGATQRNQLINGSSALQTLGQTQHVWYAFRPTSTSAAFCIRHKRSEMDVIVDPLRGADLFRACERALDDLHGILLGMSGRSVLGRRLPFTGKGVKFDKVQVFLSNSQLSGITGGPNSWLAQIASYPRLKTSLPAAAIIGGTSLVAFLVGEDIGERTAFAAVSPISLAAFGLIFSFFDARRRVKWEGP